jgi:hypothetical protein
MSEYAIAPPLNHIRNAVHRSGRVIFVPGQNLRPSGWALPGQQFTTDPDTAMRVARAIHELSEENARFERTGTLPGKSVKPRVATWP